MSNLTTTAKQAQAIIEKAATTYNGYPTHFKDANAGLDWLADQYNEWAEDVVGPVELLIHDAIFELHTLIFDEVAGTCAEEMIYDETFGAVADAVLVECFL